MLSATDSSEALKNELMSTRLVTDVLQKSPALHRFLT